MSLIHFSYVGFDLSTVYPKLSYSYQTTFTLFILHHYFLNYSSLLIQSAFPCEIFTLHSLFWFNNTIYHFSLMSFTLLHFNIINVLFIIFWEECRMLYFTHSLLFFSFFSFFILPVLCFLFVFFFSF